MRIRRVTVRNFRCLNHVDIEFEDVTTFLGPNGAGKSTILHALEWFFNGTKQTCLVLDDVFQCDPGLTVEVAVEFDRLTDADRRQLGKYATPGESSVLIRKVWDDGAEKTIGRGRVFQPFQDVRAGSSATERRALYQELRAAQPDLGLPGWTNDGNATETMAAWESTHEDRLVDADIESSSHFFGFVGQGQMSGLFDFIFVSADLRASEEATDSRSAVLGRILEQAIDRSAADAELAEVLGRAAAEQSAIQDKYFANQLTTLSEQLTAEVGALSAGRKVRISPELTPPPPQKLNFKVNVVDQNLDTRVDRQGHGFQRALLIAALKLLAESGRGTKAAPGVVCLAIEEPELYQHPLQARLFAAVLRSLAEATTRGVQVTYATHSPYFIEAKNFHQVRRVTRVQEPGGFATTKVLGSTVERVASRLDGFVDTTRIHRQLDGVCMGGLGEGFFAETVLLVEGTTDRAVLNGVAARESSPLLLDGIFVGEAGGKTNLLLPYVIFDELGIPTGVFADNDSHHKELLEAAKAEGDLDLVRKRQNDVANSRAWNRKILRFFSKPEEDWPVGRITPRLTFVDGGLEHALAKMWPGWEETRQELVDAGLGFDGKDHATYEEAALRAPGEVPEPLTALLMSVWALKSAA
jgi:energy-coupling factor transporter ATP-binding protein EcfA2